MVEVFAFYIALIVNLGNIVCTFTCILFLDGTPDVEKAVLTSKLSPCIANERRCIADVTV